MGPTTSDTNFPFYRDSIELIFDGLSVTATTSETSATISLRGYAVSTIDLGKLLAIRGGTNFVVGVYRIVSLDAGSNTWTLDRPCATGAGGGMMGKIVEQEGRWHEPVPEYFDQALPDNPGIGEARQRVLEALNLVQPRVLKSLAETCLKHELLAPQASGDHDWYGPVDFLLWGHLRDAGRFVPLPGVVFGNLKPLREAILRWAKDEPHGHWNLCDSEGEPLEWVADAAVQTLVYWEKNGRLPKNLRWENLDLHCYQSLDSEEAYLMFALEGHFDAGSGFIRVAPEQGSDFARLSNRAQRAAKREYKSLGEALGLTRMSSISARYFKWYAQRTFLKLKLREIRECELSLGEGGVGDYNNKDDLAAISHGIKRIADIIGFAR